MLDCCQWEQNVHVLFEHGSSWTRVILVPVKAKEAFHEKGRAVQAWQMRFYVFVFLIDISRQANQINQDTITYYGKCYHAYFMILLKSCGKTLKNCNPAARDQTSQLPTSQPIQRAEVLAARSSLVNNKTGRPLHALAQKAGPCRDDDMSSSKAFRQHPFGNVAP